MTVKLRGAIAALTGYLRNVYGDSIDAYVNKWVDPASVQKNQILVLSDGSDPGGDATVVVHAACFITLIGKKAEDLPEAQLAMEEKLWGAILYGPDIPDPVYRAEIKHVEHYEPLPSALCRGITEVNIDLSINYL
jgi:hypothetical protein